MIKKIKEHTGKIHIAAYSALIIYGADLLIEHGEMRATNQYQQAVISELVEDLARCEDVAQIAVYHPGDPDPVSDMAHGGADHTLLLQVPDTRVLGRRH